MTFQNLNKTTAHSQASEMAAAFGTSDASAVALQQALEASQEMVRSLQAANDTVNEELAAEKEAHAKTQAALAAATTTA